MFNQTYTAIITALQQANHVLIISHRKPDGDTIGAAMAMAHYVESLGKPFTAYCIDAPAEHLQFIPKAHLIGPHNEVWSNPVIDTIVVVDAGDLKYAGVDALIPQLPNKKVLINIDHHNTNPDYGDINLVDRNASSACEVVYHLLASVRGITRPVATCLLTGLITDTGNLTNLATTASAVDVAAKLVAKGANLAEISKHALQHRPVNTLKLWGKALERLHEDPKTGMIVTALTLEDLKECQADEEAMSGISNFLNSLDQAANKAILVLTQTTPNNVTGSLRTRNALIDVSEFAKLHGGGGHKKAAGFTITGVLEITPQGYVIHSTESNEFSSNRN